MELEMNFKGSGKSRVVFEGSERKLVNKALLNSLVSAATTGLQLDSSSPIILLSRALLNPENFSSSGITGMGPEHFDALAATVREVTANVSYEQAKEVGGFIAQLEAASRLAGSPESGEDVLDNESIDRIVENTEIPDTPEGLAP